VKKTLEDDDWRAEGAMTYLYRRGFDVYDINTILSAGALGRGKNRRLVPTRWSITAVDDTVGQFLRGSIRDNPTVNRIEVHRNEYLGNAFWVILVPGQWEYELVEMKSPGSIWNPDLGRACISRPRARAAKVGPATSRRPRAPTTRPGWGSGTPRRPRTAGEGARVAARLRRLLGSGRRLAGARGGPERLRGGEHGTAETFGEAVRGVADHLPVPLGRLRRKSTMAAGLQANLGDFVDAG